MVPVVPCYGGCGCTTLVARGSAAGSAVGPYMTLHRPICGAAGGRGGGVMLISVAGLGGARLGWTWTGLGWDGMGLGWEVCEVGTVGSGVFESVEDDGIIAGWLALGESWRGWLGHGCRVGMVMGLCSAMLCVWYPSNPSASSGFAAHHIPSQNPHPSIHSINRYSSKGGGDAQTVMQPDVPSAGAVQKNHK